MRMIFLLSLCYFLHGGSLLAQLKMEREYRINKKEVPLLARQLVDSCFGEQKIRWYAEQAIEEKTFEAKFKIKKQHFSIEFDTLGGIQDFEMQIKLKQIPDSLQAQILAALNNKFTKYKIVKIQEQWLGSRQALFYKAKGLPLPSSFSLAPVVVNYEIVVIGRHNKVYKSFELLFAADGQILSSLEIIHSSNENLIY
jgi:hypothetical protein